MFSLFQLELTQLSSLLTENDLKYCQDWALSINKNDLLNAVFENRKIGQWVSAGLHSSLLTGHLDLSNQIVENATRSFLVNGAMISIVFDRLLKNYYPDHVISYSSIHAFYRVIYELSQMRNIPVLVHERGPLDNSFICLDNENQIMSKGRVAVWQKWKNIPLTLEECQFVKKLIVDRESGVNSNLDAFFKISENKRSDIRTQLRIPKDVKIVAIFTSGEWENAMGKLDSKMSFPSQIDGLYKIIEYFRGRKEFLVIRHHPNISRPSHVDTSFIKEVLDLSRVSPENVKTIMPNEQISSYDIVWNADAVITFGSTLGFEALARGVSVVSGLGNRFTQIGVGIDLITSDFNIDSIINKTNNFQLTDLKQIYRAIYYLYNRLVFQFKSVKIKNNYAPDIKINSSDDLQRGKDIALDRVCDHILLNSSLYLEPTKDESQCIESIESEFLQNELALIKQKRIHTKDISSKIAVHESLITVIHISGIYQDTPGANTVFSTSLKRSRYKNIEIIELKLTNTHNIHSIIQDIIKTLTKAHGEAIYIGTNYTHIDESFFSHSMDIIENESRDGLISGAFICDETGCIVSEVLTDRASLSELKSTYGKHTFLNNIIGVFSLFFLKKDIFIKVLIATQDYYNKTKKLDHIFDILFSDKLNFDIYQTKIPAISIYNPQYNTKKQSPLCIFAQIRQQNDERIENQTFTEFYSKGLAESGWITKNIDTEIDRVEQFVKQIQDNKPDALYLHYTPYVGITKVVEALKKHVGLIVMQVEDQDFKKIDMNKVDIIFSSLPECVYFFRNKGVSSYYQPFVFDFQVLQNTNSLKKIYPIVYIGAISCSCEEDQLFWERLSELGIIKYWGNLDNSFSDDSLVWKRYQGTIAHQDISKILSQSSIMINKHNNTESIFSNNRRLFEITGSGALLITEYKDYLNEIFDIGKEIITFRSSDECYNLIKYYLNHKDAAEKIAKAGQERTLQYHTLSARMNNISKILFHHLYHNLFTLKYCQEGQISSYCYETNQSMQYLLKWS